MKRYALRWGLVLAMTALGVTTGGVPAAAQEIRIGILNPLSGPLAPLGQDSTMGAEVARDLVNERGGVSGRKVVLVKADAPTATAAVTEASRLIGQEGVKVIIGAYGSSISLAASAEAEKHKVIFWEMNSGSLDITGRGHRYTFRTTLTFKHLAEGAANAITKIVAPTLRMGPTDLKIVMMLEDSAYGSGMRPLLEEALGRLGIKPLAIEMYSAKSSDLSPVVLRFKSLNPDIVIAASYANDAILFVRQARQYGLNLKALIGTGAGHGQADLVRAVGRNADGIFTTGATLTINPSGLDATSRKLLDEFNSRFEKKANHFPSTHAAMGFLGTWFLLTEILPKTAGSTDPDQVREAALKADIPLGKGINGFGLKFDATGQNARAFSVVQQWQEGRLTAVYPAELATHKPILVPLPAWTDRPEK